MRGIAITDHGNMFGIKEFYNYVNKKNGGVKSEIKDLKKRISDIENGKIECEDRDAELSRCKAELEEKEKKLFNRLSVAKCMWQETAYKTKTVNPTKADTT